MRSERESPCHASPCRTTGSRQGRGARAGRRPKDLENRSGAPGERPTAGEGRAGTCCRGWGRTAPVKLQSAAVLGTATGSSSLRTRLHPRLEALADCVSLHLIRVALHDVESLAGDQTLPDLERTLSEVVHEECRRIFVTALV